MLGSWRYGRLRLFFYSRPSRRPPGDRRLPGRAGRAAAAGPPRRLQLGDQRRQFVQVFQLADPHQGQFGQDPALRAVAHPRERLVENLHHGQQRFQAQPLAGLDHLLAAPDGDVYRNVSAGQPTAAAMQSRK